MKHYVDAATTTAAAFIERGSPPESRWHVLTALNEIRVRVGLKERTIPAVSEGVGSGADGHGDAHPKEALLVSSLRWALGWIDNHGKFGPEMPPGDASDWFEWAAAHDLLKDADSSAPTPQAVQGEARYRSALETVCTLYETACREEDPNDPEGEYDENDPDGHGAVLNCFQRAEQAARAALSPDRQPEKGGEG